jgi:formate-dependent nitrite reductase membrane component NrfD
MSTYTAALLAATSTPLWSAAPRLLGVRFASSAVATAAAALSLSARVDGDPESAGTLDDVAAAATAIDLVASVAADREYEAEGVDGALRETKWGAMHTVGALAIGAVLPLACYALAKSRPGTAAANAARSGSGGGDSRERGKRDRRSRNGGAGRSSAALSVLASLAVLAGGMMTRHSIMQAGNESAKRPRDYFRHAQPRLADGSRPTSQRIEAAQRTPPRYDVDPTGDGRLHRETMPA